MSCPLCLNPATIPALTGTDFLFETTSKTFALDSCPRCRCLFLNPMPGRDEIASFYPTQYWWHGSKPSALKRLESVYRRLALSDHIAFIARAAAGRRGADLLDVGCGSGTLLGLLKRRGFRGIGVDFSAEAARLGEAENGIRVVVGSIHDARFPDGSFDIVTLFHVMEHVVNPREVLLEVFRVLRPDGAVVVQVPSIDSWQFKLFRARWYGLDIPRHLIDYSRQAMLKLLNDSGFVVHRIRHFNLRDNAPAFISSLFPSLDPVSRAVRNRKHNVREAVAAAWMKHFLYLMLVILASPLAILESAFGRGATVMIEARK